MDKLSTEYQNTRQRTLGICHALELEDYCVQPIDFVSPPKWHLAHTTWFFEAFVLNKFFPDYKAFDPLFFYLFNSYYNNAGDRVLRHHRGNCTRPTLGHILEYRKHVDVHVKSLLSMMNASSDNTNELSELLTLGIQHEQQHQELLAYDIKYILGHQPSFPKCAIAGNDLSSSLVQSNYIPFDEGLYEIGHQGDGFYYDHERGRHKYYLYPFSVASTLVTNAEYIAFIEDGGYQQFDHWLDEGYTFVKNQDIQMPLYWTKIDDQYFAYRLNGGLCPVNLNEPVMNVSFYEAAAYASWKSCRLLSEFEWEVASNHFEWGQLWEWTNSAFLPYPGFKKSEGAIGEYNGKFMVNQKVLRGASFVTPPGHSRNSYRNFFHPHFRWMFSGIRLAKSL